MKGRHHGENASPDLKTPLRMARPSALGPGAEPPPPPPPPHREDASHRSRQNVYKYPERSPEERVAPMLVVTPRPRRAAKELGSVDSDELSCSSGSNGGTPLRSPALHFGGFFHRLRQRTVSECGSDMASLVNTVSDISLSSSGGPKMGSVCEEAVASEDSGCDDLKRIWQDEEDMDVSPQNRLRSRSEASRFLVLRKMSRPNAAEVVGRFDAGERPALKILTMFTCYDLMRKQNAVLMIDTRLTTRQALGAMLTNGALGALVWDGNSRAAVGVMTITDLLGVMLNNNDHLMNWLNRALKDWIFDPQKGTSSPKAMALTCVSATEKVLSAVEKLCYYRLHRIPVVDPETRNVLFMLTLSSVLRFLHKYLSSLPLPQDMYRPIDQWKIGTWTDIRCVHRDTLASDALAQLLNYNISSLPVVKTSPGDDDEAPVVEGILTKVDIVNFISKNGWRNLAELTVDEVVRDRHSSVEDLVTCHRSAPLLLAIDQMVRQQAHRLVIIGNNNRLAGVVSIADVLRALMPAANA